MHYQYQKATNKSKVRKNKPENVLIIKGTHEPIIDMDTWNIVQRELQSHPDRLQDEQKKLRDELAAIKKQSKEFEKTEENIQSFVSLIRNMKHTNELDRPIVQALIERIEIGESRTDGDGVRNQQIDIFYKFIGKVDF